MEPMQVIWHRIEAWFETMQASELLNHFQPGATDADIQQVEALLGITFPDEIKASYHIHNGSHGQALIGAPEFWGIWELYSLEAMVDHWKRMQSQMDRFGRKEADRDAEGHFSEDGLIRYHPWRWGWWHPKWIPLLGDQSGILLCLDFAPGPAGQIGQILHHDYEDICQRVLAPGWQAFLSAFADDLEAGDYSLKRIGGKVFLL